VFDGVGDMNIDTQFSSFRRRPESSGFSSVLDPGLRRDDELGVNGTAMICNVHFSHPVKYNSIG